MTFAELVEIMFSCGGSGYKVYVFGDEGSAAQFIEDDDQHDGLLFVYESILRPEVTLLKKWCKAKVQMIYPMYRNTLAVVVDEAVKIINEKA